SLHSPTRPPPPTTLFPYTTLFRSPKDTDLFQRASQELTLKHAQLTAFGATRRAGVQAADDPQVVALRESGASVVTLVAKSDERHVERALRTTLDENLAMIADTVSHLRAHRS